jgi:hypothetical protein
MQNIYFITRTEHEKLHVDLPEYFIICQEMQGVEVSNFPMWLPSILLVFE